MIRKAAILISMLAGVLCLVALAGLEQENKAPDFDLFGVDYKYHSLSDYTDRKAVVVAFTCNHCPVAQDYEDTLISIAKSYQPKGIQFIAINPNPADMVAADGFPQMIQRAKEKKFPYPYVYDERQKVARAYKATVTPHVFVVGPKGDILYAGAVDNRHNKPDYLIDALEDVLAGREVKRPETAQFGCSVKYRKEAEKKFDEKKSEK